MSSVPRATFPIPSDFPHPQRLGGSQLYCSVLSTSLSTLHRWMADGKIPKPMKFGQQNRWPETVMAASRDAGAS